MPAERESPKLRPVKYVVEPVGPSMSEQFEAIHIEARQSHTGERWAITWRSYVWTRKGWEYEMRTDAFLKRARWTFDEAVAQVEQAASARFPSQDAKFKPECR